MKKKYKVTGFTRLVVFMVLFAPLAYMGAHYYQGDDGWQKLKSLVGIEVQMTKEQCISNKKEEIKNLETKLNRLKADLDQLSAQE